MTGLFDYNGFDPTLLPVTEPAEEYLNWKNNTGLLYSFLTVHNLEWPALSLDWDPKTTKVDDDQLSQRIILGTHAAQPKDNYLYVLECLRPSKLLLNNDQRKYDIQKDYGGFHFNNSTFDKKFFCPKFIPHPAGEIQRIRICPHDSNLAATVSLSGFVSVIDVSSPDSDSLSIPENQIKFSATHKPPQEALSASSLLYDLKGNLADGWGLAWSPLTPHRLAASTDTGCITVWDIGGQTGSSSSKRTGRQSGPSSVSALHSFSHGHGGTAVQDLKWHSEVPALLLSVGDDGHLVLRDIRVADSPKGSMIIGACGGATMNCIDISPRYSWLMATGTSDSNVILWDLRKPMDSLHTLIGHDGNVNTVHFSPHKANLLLSAACDRKAVIWDIGAIGREQYPEEVDDGPPEILFIHSGHLGMVQEARWNTDPNEENNEDLIASVCDSNHLQIWQVEKTTFMRINSDCEDNLSSSDNEEDKVAVE